MPPTRTVADPTRAGAGLARATGLMAAGTLVSRMLGLVRLALLTACVGAPLVGSAFQVANTLPSYVFQLLAGGVLNAVLLPQIIRAAQRPDGGRGFTDRLVTAAVGAVLLLSVLVTVAARPLVEATTAFGPAATDLAVFFALVCLPQTAGYGLYAVLSQLLNAHGQFAAVMWAPALANVVQIAGLLVFLRRYVFAPQLAQWSPEMVWWVAGSMTAGIWVQAVVLVIPLIRGGFRWRPRFDLRGHGLWTVSRIAGWAFLALVVAQVGGLFTQWVLTRVEQDHPGQPVATVYEFQIAFVIFMLPHSMITTSVLTALSPRLAVALRDRDVWAQRAVVHAGLTVPALAVVPIGAAAVVLAGPVVALIQPGLSADQVHVTAQLLMIMVLGLVPFGVTVLQQRFAFAAEQGRRNLWLQGLLTAFAVLAGVVALLVPAAQAGRVVAAGMTVGEWVTAVVFVVLVHRQLGGLDLAGLGALHLRLAGAAGAAVTVGLVVGRTSAVAAASAPVQLVVGGVALGTVYVIMVAVLRIGEYRTLLDDLRRRVARAGLLSAPD